MLIHLYCSNEILKTLPKWTQVIQNGGSISSGCKSTLLGVIGPSYVMGISKFVSVNFTFYNLCLNLDSCQCTSVLKEDRRKQCWRRSV